MVTLPGLIRWKLLIDAPVIEVFEALDSAADRRVYWAPSPQDGDGFIRFSFKNGEREVCTLVRREPGRSWAITYFGGIAAFSLEETSSGQTDLTLTHEPVGAEDYLDTYAGWLNVLLPLKAWVQHRIILRNEDPARLWNQGYADG